MKECTNCHTNKPLTEFRRNKNAKDGYQHFCKECASQKIKEAYREQYNVQVKAKTLSRHLKHSAIVTEMKRSGCVICGENEPICIDFHHLDPSQKDFEVSSRYGRSLDSILSELQKCVCLCSNCHRKVHAGLITLEDRSPGVKPASKTGPPRDG